MQCRWGLVSILYSETEAEAVSVSEIEVSVDQTACIQCGACVALCASAGVFAEVDGATHAVAPQECWLCGHCVAVCPSDAIVHSGFALSDCPGVDPVALPSLGGLVMAFRERRSARVFEQRPVPRQVVRELVDLSRWVPSASNEQPVDWLAFDQPERIAALGALTVQALTERAKGLRFAADLERMAQRQARGEDPIFFRSPVVLMAHVPISDAFGRDDAVFATYNLMLAAQRMGLGTCQIGYFQEALKRSEDLKRMLGLAENRRSEVTLALGYPVHSFQRLIPRRRPELLWAGD
jgi:nitroreductase/Pyruvate/2-oxoacid:ferredoxin oxidoreductase delta subunit